MKRRARNRERKGVVVEVNPNEGLYRVQLREAEGNMAAYLTPWIPVEALSTGHVKIQGEPVIGQPVLVRSESGDMSDAVIALSSFSDANPRPHDKNGELKIDVSNGAYWSLLRGDGSEETKAVARTHSTDGDVVFETGGVVYFR